MRELRPQLASEEAFVRLVDDVLRPEGYRLIGAFEDAWPHAAAIAGFRTSHSVAWGHHLYVDDLSTLPTARRPTGCRFMTGRVPAPDCQLGT
jgi:hypothetical protein